MLSCGNCVDALDDDLLEGALLLADLLDGKVDVLFGHPESFDSPLGRRILKELQRRSRIILGKFSSERNKS